MNLTDALQVAVGALAGAVGTLAVALAWLYRQSEKKDEKRTAQLLELATKINEEKNELFEKITELVESVINIRPRRKRR
jgi:uncharacterized membrane protein